MKGLQYSEPCAYLIFMKMLYNKVYYNYTEIKIRCVGGTPNIVTNTRCNGFPNLANAYCYRLFV